MGDNIHPTLDCTVHLSGWSPLHHHLCWDPPADAGCQCRSTPLINQLCSWLQFPGGTLVGVPGAVDQQAGQDCQDLLFCCNLPTFPHIFHAHHHLIWDQRRKSVLVWFEETSLPVPVWCLPLPPALWKCLLQPLHNQ